MDDDYQLSDTVCPKCGHEPTHYRTCSNFGCEDGYIDDWEDDAINFSMGESYSMCQECWGTGIEKWCPKCGTDLSLLEYKALRRAA